MQLPFELQYPLPVEGDPGYFAAVRKFDIHTGIDLYCRPFEPVYAIENGIVVKVEEFTGPNVGSPWWNSTEAVLIEGKSGVIVYGEISIVPGLEVNDKICKGDLIGNVIPVLKTQKSSIPQHMLHLELMSHGNYDTLIWDLDTEQPDALLNPIVLLKNSK